MTHEELIDQTFEKLGKPSTFDPYRIEQATLMRTYIVEQLGEEAIGRISDAAWVSGVLDGLGLAGALVESLFVTQGGTKGVYPSEHLCITGRAAYAMADAHLMTRQTPDV